MYNRSNKKSIVYVKAKTLNSERKVKVLKQKK